MGELWPPTLRTDTPQAGFEPAIKLARHGVKATQPSHEIRGHLRAAFGALDILFVNAGIGDFRPVER